MSSARPLKETSLSLVSNFSFALKGKGSPIEDITKISGVFIGRQKDGTIVTNIHLSPDFEATGKTVTDIENPPQGILDHIQQNLPPESFKDLKIIISAAFITEGGLANLKKLDTSDKAARVNRLKKTISPGSRRGKYGYEVISNGSSAVLRTTGAQYKL